MSSDSLWTDPRQIIEDDWRRTLVRWNETGVDYDSEVCLHQLIEAQADRTPDVVALIFENKQLTYRELDQKANQLAHHLGALSVGPEVLVGICVERSVEMVVGLLGILKAGGAYVPLDPEYPVERLSFMIADARAPVLLTQAKIQQDLPEQAAQIVCLDGQWDDLIASESQERPAGHSTGSNLAYVIYTSGSTGKPKGVMNSHRGISNRLFWMQDEY